MDFDNYVMLVDSRIVELNNGLVSKHPHIIIHAHESRKTWAQVSDICEQLLQLKADRNTTLIGIGGGITTDITGFVASIYMRGIPFGFIPTTLLAMCDAAIGGKNGINHQLQKNLIGTVQQPAFIFYDTIFLNTLPPEQWSNGFAEIIKYACLFDRALFDELEQNDITHYRNHPEALQLLIERCVDWKNNVVMSDEKESGRRKLLNFGHTAGHAIETLHQVPHGYAVAAGMVIAAKISEHETNLDPQVTERLKTLLQRYGLPVSLDIDTGKVMEVLNMDKKRNSTGVDYILLNNIGEAAIKHLPFPTITQALETYAHAGSH